jgi:DNA (cytosine-5)-methyltransferase 1
MVAEAKPTFFLLENVPGIVSARRGRIVADLQHRLAKLGYQVAWSLLNAVDFGAPQRRIRFFMLGSRVCHPIFPFPANNAPVRTLRQSIFDLEDNPGECLQFPPSLAKWMARIPEGGCWRCLPPRLRKQAMGKADLSSGGLTAFYRRLSYDKPSPTLLVSPVQRATTLCHPRRDRPLSVTEYKRIQCFPEEWAIEGNVREKYRQLGNAVPVLLAEAVGRMIMRMHRMPRLHDAGDSSTAAAA